MLEEKTKKMMDFTQARILVQAFIAVTLFRGSTVYAYQITVPVEHVAFSGDLVVIYKIPDDVSLSNAFIRVALVTDKGDEEITNLHIDSKYKTGRLPMTCGIIEVAGKYEFQMYMYGGGPLLTRAVMLVRWPKIVLHLNDTHFAQSSSVLLRINSSAVCNPRLKRYDFKIELDYATNSSTISVAGNHEVLYSQPFEDFSGVSLFVVFPCSLFDIPGIYRASLISSFSAISVVSRSNLMLTTFNPAYMINFWSETIFPCNGNVKIGYSLPQCAAPMHNNRIRIYMRRRKSLGSLAAPVEKMYIEEHKADPGGSLIQLPCHVFDTVAIGYCFQLVTFLRHDTLLNQTEYCLPAHPDSVLPIDGGWSSWSDWSGCSATCGPGQQTRYRMCDSPTPNFGGAFCEGDSIQRRDCDIFCPDSIPLTPLHSPHVDGTCACGCHMIEERGEIIASGRCTHTSKWLISVPKDHFIKLKFSYLNLYEDKQWVKVRNGGQPDSDLVAFSDGRSNIDGVTSTTNQMLVEFFTEPDETDGSNNIAIYPTVPTKAIHVHGFIASFESNRTEAVSSTVAVQSVKASDEPSIWESTVTIVGISLCGLVVVTAVAFVIYHRTCHRRQHKYAMAAHEESPKRICKSTSMSSPSHSSHQGIEIEHDMQVPLTGAAGVDRKRAKTPGSTQSKGSLSSTCSNKVKMLRTKADIEHGGSCRASPLSPNREYIQISQDASPRKKHRVREITQDSENNMSLFRTSPLTKPKVPRSPKVHPSPKLKKQKPPSCSSNENSDTLRTKNDILSKRFGRREGERVVMGSDITPTNGVKSPPPESVKMECETPTNIDHDMYKKHVRHKHERDEDKTLQRDKSGDINLKDLKKSNDGMDRKPASGTSDESTSAEKDAGSQMTTSFIENGVKPRRPTSLTESYSKMSLASAVSRGSTEGAGNGPEAVKDKTSVTSSDDRQNALPKPDGQSPKSQRLEVVKTESRNASPSKTSKASTPHSVRSLRSDSSNTKSPARSINTPSDVMELEYDDFVDMDDTYSYFDPIVTEQLTFHGVEKVSLKTPKTPKTPMKD